MLAIFNKELKSYFKSPTGYVFMTFYLVFFGIYFTLYNLLYRNPDYSLVISNALIMLVISIPVITMRLLSEERRTKTDQLILTCPVKVSDFVVGKYLAALALFCITTLLTVLQPLALSTFGALPVAKILGSYIGLILLASTFIAIGLFMSSVTENQIVAAILTIVIFLLMALIDSLAQALPKDRFTAIIFACVVIAIIATILYFTIRNIYVTGIIAVIGFALLAAVYFINPILLDGFVAKFFSWFSLIQRYSNFSLGVFDLSSVVYYISFSTIFVFLSIQQVEKKRWS